jgi:hypothetical protein
MYLLIKLFVFALSQQREAICFIIAINPVVWFNVFYKPGLRIVALGARDAKYKISASTVCSIDF